MLFTIAARARKPNLAHDGEMTRSRLARANRQKTVRMVNGVRKVYRGRDIEVSFDLDICIHVAECLRGQRKVFELNRRPWILADAAGADEVADVVRRCPSGALLYRRLDGGAQEDPDGPTTVTPIR